jgi:hypothetical protein
MVRRARKANARELASYQRGVAKSNLRELAKEAKRITARAVQSAAIEISNGLVKAGPIWSGRFASSWYLENVGSLGGPRVKGSIYKYSAKDFRVTSVEKALDSGIYQFQLVNTAPHAGIALDQETGIYKHPSDADPLKDPVEFGFRPMDGSGNQEQSLRWDINIGYDSSAKPNAMITAEADWLSTYAMGGGLSRDLGRGVTLALRT